MSKETAGQTRTGTVKHTDGRTARVVIAETKLHRIYKKRYTVHQQLLADVPAGQKVEIGDTVTITPTRRLSKLKSWRIVK